ncbi:MAG: hypothetical protein KA791_10885 [Flavobacteriales bacterium]|nr:hypothetical protein [Flavobacteriales bacterium]
MRKRRMPIAPAVVLVILACAPVRSLAQVDTDSAAIYDRIHRFAERRKVTRWLYDAVFVEPPDTVERKEPGSPRVVRDPNRRFKGIPIRRIDVRVLDPFGGNVDDTSAVSRNRLERWGNALHMRTRERVVRGRLLFAEGDRLDPLRLSESERVLRSTPMVNDARVRAHSVKDRKDSVDVVVLVQDRWTLDGGIGGDQTSVSANVVERNLLGTGQEFTQTFDHDLDAQRSAWSGTHRVYAIGSTFIGSTAGYALQPAQDDVSFSLERPFYSPVARWAGSAAVGHSRLRAQLDTSSTGAPFVPVANRFLVDGWFGWNLSPNNLGKASDGMRERVVAARFADTWFVRRLTGSPWDTTYVGSRLALVSFSLGARRYTKDGYLYRFGQTEDVVEGVLWTTTTGLRWPERERAALYIGTSFTRAAYMGFGDHLSVRVAVGGMAGLGSIRDGLALLDLDLFSRTFPMGRWRLRQFVRGIAVRSIGTTTTYSVTIPSDQLVGFSRPVWTGASKFLLRTETVAYAPWSLLGFRFAPVFSMGIGTVTGPGVRPLEGTLQPAFGLGVLFRNERLLIRGFQVSFAFYPTVFNDTDMWQWDALRSLGLRTADLAPSRPEVITAP